MDAQIGLDPHHEGVHDDEDEADGHERGGVHELLYAVVLRLEARFLGLVPRTRRSGRYRCISKQAVLSIRESRMVPDYVEGVVKR